MELFPLSVIGALSGLKGRLFMSTPRKFNAVLRKAVGLFPPLLKREQFPGCLERSQRPQVSSHEHSAPSTRKTANNHFLVQDLLLYSGTPLGNQSLALGLGDGRRPQHLLWSSKETSVVVLDLSSVWVGQL